ncbi:MAG: protein adenylyltransferase SelO [Gammaproteobacteria bacterium]
MFDNSYARLPDRMFAAVQPAKVPAPRLLAWNEELAKQLGLSEIARSDDERAQLFGGNQTPDGAKPIALAYAGHQFGHFVPQLGDGRAILLGEVIGADGKRRDIQLKGSGQTPFSRRGDGKSSLGPVIREYLLSEAMHRLGIPTTRALAAVATGETVYRESGVPGGVLTRVAASHMRVGTFEYFAARGDKEALKTLADYAMDRHYPEARNADQPISAFFAGVVENQARLIAQWMSVGFIHGVMNTDNCAISGETLDYGPCAFMDEFDYDKVFSSIDGQGRYAFSRQPATAQWNLARLAECLMELDEPRESLIEGLNRFQGVFEQAYYSRMANKLGIGQPKESDHELINEWLQWLQDQGLDFTLSFRGLANRLSAGVPEGETEFGDFETRWHQRLVESAEPLERIRERMNAINPLYIPRNHQVERAIQAAFAGDYSVFQAMHRVLAEPYTEQAGCADYAQPPQQHERVEMTFCGT